MTKKIKDYTVAERDGIKLRFMQHLHRTGMISALDIKLADGSKPIIVAFEDEEVGAIIDKAEVTDGNANLFVLMEEGSHVASMGILSDSATPILGKVAAEHLQIRRDSHIGMIVHAAEINEGALVLSFDTGAADFLAPEYFLVEELLAA